MTAANDRLSCVHWWLLCKVLLRNKSAIWFQFDFYEVLAAKTSDKETILVELIRLFLFFSFPFRQELNVKLCKNVHISVSFYRCRLLQSLLHILMYDYCGCFAFFGFFSSFCWRFFDSFVPFRHRRARKKKLISLRPHKKAKNVKSTIKCLNYSCACNKDFDVIFHFGRAN